MKQCFITILAVVFASTFFAAEPASAHVLKVDGHIAAVLHINPDDDPISGVPTKYLLFFDDETNRFTLAACTCQVSIQEHGKTIATESIYPTSPTDSSNSYTFPNPDVYTLVVSGRPKRSASFQPFSLSYLVRVSGGVGATAQPFPFMLGVGLTGAMALILLACYAEMKSPVDKEIL